MMDELEKLLNISLGPHTDGKNFIEVKCYCDFEGHGRASETWEKHWRLTLPQIQGHWKSTKGWKQCTDKHVRMSFHGRTFEEVVTKAKEFLKEYE